MLTSTLPQINVDGDETGRDHLASLLREERGECWWERWFVILPRQWRRCLPCEESWIRVERRAVEKQRTNEKERKREQDVFFFVKIAFGSQNLLLVMRKNWVFGCLCVKPRFGSQNSFWKCIQTGCKTCNIIYSRIVGFSKLRYHRMFFLSTAIII